MTKNKKFQAQDKTLEYETQAVFLTNIFDTVCPRYDTDYDL